MFNDYSHSQTIIYIKDKKYAIKTLDDPIVLKKEYEIMKYIEKLNISPKVLGLRGCGIIEEYIDGENFYKVELEDSLIVEFANKINKLHSIVLSEDIKVIIRDEFVRNEKYLPLMLFEHIVKKIAGYVDYKMLRQLFIRYDDYLKRKGYKLGLVHGDLNPGNIIRSKRGIVFVDWADCRYDILSCDVSQLFYVFNFSAHQKDLFLKNYDSAYVDDVVLEMHYLLLLLFELSDVYNKKKILNEEIVKKIDDLLIKFRY